MASNLFPEGMLKASSGSSFTLESVAGSLRYFHLQLHLNHLKTISFEEHNALDKLYNYVDDFVDSFIEKMMGYTGKRISAFKIAELKDNIDSKTLVSNLQKYAHSLYEWAEEAGYCDLENMSQDLSGQAAQTLYRLTLI